MNLIVIVAHFDSREVFVYSVYPAKIGMRMRDVMHVNSISHWEFLTTTSANGF